MSQETFQETFSVEGLPMVSIGNVRGQVTVQPGEPGVVSIRAVRHNGERGSRTEVEIWQEQDGSVHARARHDQKSRLLSFMDSPAKVDFTVTVPPETNLSVKCVSADMDVHGLHGELLLKSVSGRIAVRELAGEPAFESVSGRISGEKVSGPLTIKTVSGKVILKESDLPGLTATSVSGAMELDTPLGEGPYRLKTVSGSVNLRVPEGTGGRVHFKSLSGRARFSQEVVSSDGAVRAPGGPRKQTFILAGEGPEIRFSSVSGSLNLIGPEDIAVEGPDTPDVAAMAEGPVDRMSILERIASGEMSVEDGVEAMKN